MGDHIGDIGPSRREVIKKTAWAVPAIASFSLVSSSPAAAYSNRPRDQQPGPRPGHVSNQTDPGYGSNQPPKPGHGSNQTDPGYGSNQPPKPGHGSNQT